MGVRSFDELKVLLQPKVRERWGFSILQQGLPRGGITEVSGCGKTELALRFLSEHPEIRAAWVESNFSVYPLAFLQWNVSLNRILFIDGAQDTEWAVLQVLKSQVFPVVVIYLEKSDINTLRRWQLAAEKTQAAVLWLTPFPQKQWPISLQLRTERRNDEELEVSILRQRYY